MNSRNDERPRRRDLLLGCAIFAVIGAMAMMYLYGPALTSNTKYHSDLTQTPHWVAYHGDAFPDDDLMVEYATYGESPLQNGIYWVGTWFMELVPLNKIVGIGIFGLTAALFFWLVSSMSGLWTGTLAALFFVIFPRSAYEIAGGFSKAWAIALVLIGVYVVETRSWKNLLWLMPLAALTYPVTPILIGALVLVGLLMDVSRAADEAIRGVKYLTAASGFALVPLLYKYFTPPEAIGEMISTPEMNAIWERGEFGDVTVPLWEDVLRYLDHPFFIYSTILLLILLHRRGLVWKRSWSALIAAAAGIYVLADLVVPRLYLPDRYTRFSIVVLMILWQAHNWSRVLEVFRRRWVRWAAFAAVVAVAAMFFSNVSGVVTDNLAWAGKLKRVTGAVDPTFRPGDGSRSLNRWSDKKQYAPLSRVVASLPSPVLLTGHPYYIGHVMLQSKRPVLVNHRLAHPWYAGYSATIDERVRDTLRALYASHVGEVNRLVDRYGVTQLVIRKAAFQDRWIRKGLVYEPQYHDLIQRLARRTKNFVLAPPPKSAILFEDASFWLVQLPLEEPAP